MDVKRAFVNTHLLRKLGMARKRDLATPTKSKYSAVQKVADSILKELNEKQLDKYLKKKPGRLHAYNQANWYICEVETRELGAWEKAGGLPREWTRGSLIQTSRLVKEGLEDNSKLVRKRAKRILPIIIKLKSTIQRHKYSLPIIFERKISIVKRPGLKKMPFEIDDGNVRAIAYAISGDKTFRAYVGFKRAPTSD